MRSDLVDDKYDILDDGRMVPDKMEAACTWNTNAENRCIKEQRWTWENIITQYRGKTYPLYSPWNAAEQIEDEYIPVTKMVDCLLGTWKLKIA